MSNTSQTHTVSTENNNIVERKIEKYISFFSIQPRIQGYSNSVKTDLDRLRQYSSITYTLDTQSQWITK